MRFMYRHVQQTCVIPTHIGSRKARFRRAFQLSRTPFARVRSCKLCSLSCTSLGCRTVPPFVRTPLNYTTGTNPSGTPRRVPTRARVLHTIGYLSEHLPLRRLWWLFGADIPEPLSLSLFHLRCSQHVSNRWNPLDILGPFLQDSEHLRLQNQNPQ